MSAAERAKARLARWRHGLRRWWDEDFDEDPRPPAHLTPMFQVAAIQAAVYALATAAVWIRIDRHAVPKINPTPTAIAFGATLLLFFGYIVERAWSLRDAPPPVPAGAVIERTGSIVFIGLRTTGLQLIPTALLVYGTDLGTALRSLFLGGLTAVAIGSALAVAAVAIAQRHLGARLIYARKSKRDADFFDESRSVYVQPPPVLPGDGSASIWR